MKHNTTPRLGILTKTSFEMATSFTLAVLACATAVSAHGYVSTVTANGQAYSGYNPSIAPWEPDQVRMPSPSLNPI